MPLTMSVVIPTYNRALAFERLLKTLDQQTFPADQWEVIAVDDGSTDPEYGRVTGAAHRFAFRFLRQNHEGSVAARNLGACNSQAEFLLFLDDDIVVEPDFIACLLEAHRVSDRAILMGTFIPYNGGEESPFRKAIARFGVTQNFATAGEEVLFTDVVSHNLSMKRNDWLEIGMFQDPTGGKGWAPWDDTDLAYRAKRMGFIFRQVPGAVGSHVDGVQDDFRKHCDRIQRAARSVHYLFAKYPELAGQLPMFLDKTPVDLSKDSPRLALRKCFRAITAWKPVLRGMEWLIGICERRFSNSILLVELYRWVNSSYIYNGYRSGLAA
ncbi:MAG TPA: glycosyltransferase family 2 protein [Anaerolineales bacterium]